MKVVHLNTYADFGGAGIAGQRLVNALNNLHQGTATYLDGSLPPAIFTKFNFAADTAYFALKEAKAEYRFAFSPGIFGRNLRDVKEVKDADVVHIHWINQGFLSLSNLKKIAGLNKPIVWTLHDMWSFTGGCHYPGPCDHFKRSCGDCYFLKNPNDNDLSHKGWLRKKSTYEGFKNITFITCSNWLAGIAKQSSLLKNLSIATIPNPIDTELFHPVRKTELRRKWNIDAEVKVILFGAANINDRRKGINYLVEALKKYTGSGNENVEIVIFGKNKSFDAGVLPFKVHNLSVINSQSDMAEVYNLADVFVLPSLEDNLPNTVMEAMACGTPVVAFNTGGIPDMIDNRINGYLAEYQSPEDLANGIKWVLENDRSALSENARKKVMSNFSNEVVARQYMNLYQTVLNG